MNITATTCSIGKRHNWRFLFNDEFNELHWCKKCGSITEWATYEGRRVRCKDGRGGLYIDTPLSALKQQESSDE